MSDPFLSEIKIISWTYAPKGWAYCDGQILPINQNQALFSLLGTTYGGDGRVDFALPDLRGRMPLHMGNGLTIGGAGGSTTHTLTTAELAAHSHTVNCVSSGAGLGASTGNTWGTSGLNPYSKGPATAAMNATLVTSASGGAQPHDNAQPYLVLGFIIALQGIFPTQN
jgi:microcystin-dependent protein